MTPTLVQDCKNTTKDSEAYLPEPIAAKFAGVVTRPAWRITARETFLIWLVLSLFLWPKYIGLSLLGVNLNAFSACVLVGLALGALSIATSGRVRLGSRGAAPIAAFVVLWWTADFASSLSGVTADASFYIATRDLLFSGTVFFLAAAWARAPSALFVVARIICYCSLILCTIALIEFISGQSTASLLGRFLSGSVNDDFARQLMSDKSRNGMFRSSGVFIHPIVLGEYVGAILPVAIWMIFNSRQRMLGALTIVACLISAFLTGARSAQAALFVGPVIYGLCLLVSRRSRLVWGIVLVASPLLIVAVFPVVDYFNTLISGSGITQVSSAARDIMWQRGWIAFVQSPWIGYGAGRDVELAGIFSGIWTIDDYYLTILMTSGVVGCALLGLSFLSLLLHVLSMDVTGRHDYGLPTAFFAGIVAICVGQRATSITEGMTVVYLFSGLLTAAPVFSSSITRNHIVRASRRVAA